MARKLNQKSTLQTTDDATACMRELKEVTIELGRIQAEADEARLNIEKKIEELVSPLAERKLTLEQNLKLFSLENRSLFTETRKVKTPFGSYGFHLMPPSVVSIMKRIADNIASMKAGGKRYTRFIKVKEDLDRAGIKAAVDAGELSPADLSAIGLAIRSEEEFVYHIDSQELGV
jgi:phage host-nuclease inhibitor protein Gam